MSFLNNLKKNLSDAADYTVRKTGEMTDVAKKHLEIRTCNSHLTKCYENLGRAFYKAEKGMLGANDLTPAEYIAEADRLQTELEQLRLQLAVLQGRVICPACGAQTCDHSVFCPMCGTKLLDESTAADETAGECEFPPETAPDADTTDGEN